MLSNLLTVAQGSQTRTFTYSSLSRLRTSANPESGTTTYSYDNNGNLTSKVDARSITTSYTYDALNRITQRSYNDSPQTPTVTYTYDNVTNAKGRLTKVSSSVSTTEYTAFDILGRVTAHKQALGGVDYATTYTYNLAGQLLEETYPSGRTVKNTIATDGDLSQVETKPYGGSFTNRASGFTYTAAGAVSSMQLGNGKWESTLFNSRLQPTRIGLGTSSTDTSLLKLEYGFGTANNGNVVSQTITVPGLANPFVQNYTYDALNRIATATETNNGSQTWTQSFGYDRYGNRNITAGTGVTNLTFNSANNRITSSGYSFDNAGNTTADPSGKTFAYDAENKQTSVSNGSIGTYSYDGDGKRIKKTTSTGDDRIFVYDAGGVLIEEYYASSPTWLATSYIYAGSRLLSTETVSATNYLTADHLGSPRINTDATGAVTSRHDYHPFGEEILTAQRTTGLKYVADTVRKQFTGYERDNETNLDFAGARYHDFSLGRFSSPDPLLLSAKLENPQTWNRYAYVLNNPLSLIDQEGLYPSPAFNCSDTVKTCLNDEQRRILSDSKVKIKGEIRSGEDLYKRLDEKQQNAFVNLTDKLGSLKTADGATFLSQVKNVTDIQNDRILAGVDTGLASHLKNSEQFSPVRASDHAPFDAVSYKNNDTTFGNIQLSFNKTLDGADIDIDIGNMKSGDVAGPVVHFFEVAVNKIFDRQTNQNRVRRLLLADPKVQTITPSPDAKYNRRQK